MKIAKSGPCIFAAIKLSLTFHSTGSDSSSPKMTRPQQLARELQWIPPLSMTLQLEAKSRREKTTILNILQKVGHLFPLAQKHLNSKQKKKQNRKDGNNQQETIGNTTECMAHPVTADRTFSGTAAAHCSADPLEAVDY